MSTNAQGTLYLIPNTLGEDALERTLPSYNSAVVAQLNHFLAEDEKTARKLIKQLVPSATIQELSIQRLNEHTKPSELESLMAPLRLGSSMGIISDAGCPAIADPGTEVVRKAHEEGIKVVPLVGPCSMVLALMASGLNGQTWRFQGYIPVDGSERATILRSLEHRVESFGETQIFMDTPYRTQRLFTDILKACKPSTVLCVAQGLTTKAESIKTASVGAWRNATLPTDKIATLFLLGESARPPKK